MNNSDQLVKKSIEEKSKIRHRLDEAVITALSFKKHGYDPFLSHWEGKFSLDWRMSNRNLVFNDFFEKLVELEPLFNNVSNSFKKNLQGSFFSKFESFFSKHDLFVDVEMINWILIYSDFRGYPLVKLNYTQDDFLLIKKLDIDYFKAIDSIEKNYPNIYRDYENSLKKEDSILYYKLNPKKAS